MNAKKRAQIFERLRADAPSFNRIWSNWLTIIFEGAYVRSNSSGSHTGFRNGRS